ncbi:MAG: prolyl oligopeptidase family serine peptidase [Acidiferrobacterales bacterium]
MPENAPYGSWRSPISADMIAGDTVSLDQPELHNHNCYWIERRPTEGGRQVIVQQDSDNNIKELLPPPFSARSRVHEYGGAAYAVAGEQIYFVNDSDQGIYVIESDKLPKIVYRESGLRFADLQIDRSRNRLVCVCEDHGINGEGEVTNTLVALDLADKPSLTTLHQGADFYASPALRADARSMAWLSWNHPNMPWDGTELWLADFDTGGELHEARCIAGGEDVSIFQPQWSPDNQLYFVSDVAGWWQLYRQQTSGPKRLCDVEAEFGLPQWVFGQSTYGFISADTIACCYNRQGEWLLALLCTRTGSLSRIDIAYGDITNVRANKNRVIFLAGSPTSTSELVAYHTKQKDIAILKKSVPIPISGTCLSVAQKISFADADGSTAHGFYYEPKNGDYSAPTDEQPPLIVMSHGGPTAATGHSLNLKIQFWTSRGFAVLDVNYRGSTGYGRAYRQRLDGRWGIVDVQDCENGANYLADAGYVDKHRLIICGSSAGGYTTLCALTFTNTFSAGASLYGIGDLEALARDTHKFESHYLDRLVGTLPESRQTYRERSPLFHADKLSCPVIFFQGEQDQVVPPSQAESMVAALRQNGIAVGYLLFAGEQHGFRLAKTIARVLEAELYFYGKVFGFEPADKIEAVTITNGPD